MHHLPMLTTWLTYQPSSNFALFQNAPPPPHVYPSRPQTTGVIGARIPQALVGAGLTYISCYQRGQALPCPDLVLSYASAPPPPHPSVRYCCGRVWRHLTYHALKPLLSWRAVWPPEAYKCVYPDQLTLVLGANVIATILFININFPL